MSSPNVFSPAPSLTAATNTTVVDSIPDDADAVGVMLTPSGDVPETVGFSRESLAAYGFEGKAGEAFMVPSAEGTAVVAVGIGDDEPDFRRAGAAFSRACGRLGSLALVVDDAVIGDGDVGQIAEALVEGALLARYSYSALKSEPDPSPVTDLALVVAASHSQPAQEGVDRGRVLAAADRPGPGPGQHAPQPPVGHPLRRTRRRTGARTRSRGRSPHGS